MLLTGDDAAVAATVGRATGIADVHAEASPEDKAAIVGALRREGEVVVMVGDGLNDAPALAAADIGVALGATGSTISSDAADAVILVDDLGRVAEAIEIGRDTLRVARTGIVIGMGLSAVLMVIAALGGIQPLHGALAQEAIDVAAILNGLRALGGRDGSLAPVGVGTGCAPRRPEFHAVRHDRQRSSPGPRSMLIRESSSRNAARAVADAAGRDRAKLLA